MVARFSTGGKYEQHAETTSRIIGAADGLIGETLGLADADEAAFQAVIASYKLSAANDTERAARAAAINDALAQAAQPPARLIQLSGAIVDLAAELLDIANPNVISDIAAAADAARAAATTARVNIDINVTAIKDAQARAALAEQTDGLEEKVVLAADSLARQVRERILR
jgi:formiminotetrahydrofolate cyclodeaminase